MEMFGNVWKNQLVEEYSGVRLHAVFVQIYMQLDLLIGIVLESFF